MWCSRTATCYVWDKSSIWICFIVVPYLYCKMFLTDFSILWFSRHLDDSVNTDWMIQYIDL